MKNWKTTASSAVSAASAFVLFASQTHMMAFPSWATAIATFTMAGGLAAFGIAAKDSQTTGGTNGQPSSTEAMVAAGQMPLASPVVTTTVVTAGPRNQADG